MSSNSILLRNKLRFGQNIMQRDDSSIMLMMWMCLMQEVAVKKFLDQDFLGDALDEFISEVKCWLY